MFFTHNSHLILTTLEGMYCYPHFTDEESEDQGHSETLPQAHCAGEAGLRVQVGLTPKPRALSKYISQYKETIL